MADLGSNDVELQARTEKSMEHHLGATCCTEEERNKLEEERKALEKEKEAWSSSHSRLEASQAEEPIVFNVGGTYFATSVETLTKIPDTYFATLVGGRWNLEKSKRRDGAIFVDRSPKYFGWLLDFMRDYPLGDANEMLALLTTQEQLILRREVDFFLIPRNLIFEHYNSRNEDAWWLLRLPLENTFSTPVRLYKWQNGDDQDNFHSLCDGKGPTVAIAILSDGSVVGAYTSKSYTSGPVRTHSDPTAFLFKLSPDGSYLRAPQVFAYDDSSVFCTGYQQFPTFGKRYPYDYQWVIQSSVISLRTKSGTFASLDLPPISTATAFEIWSVRYCPTTIDHRLDLFALQLGAITSKLTAILDQEKL